MNSKSNKKRSIYNEDIKSKYVAYAVSVSESTNLELLERGIINRFYRSGQLESKMGKDIFEFNPSEAKEFLEHFLTGGVIYQSTTISTLRTYVEWAIENGLTPVKENPFKGIKPTDIDTARVYVDTMVRDEDDLIQSLDTVLCDVELDTTDNFRWCVLLLIFAGIPFKDVFYIRQDDVNLNDRIIHYGSQTIHINDGLYRVLQHFMNMDALQTNGKYSEYSKAIVHEGYLLSNTKAYGNNREKMRLNCVSDISMVMKECAKKLKPTSILDSGIFYRMYLKKQATGKVDCLEYLRVRRTRNTVIDYPEKVKKVCMQEYAIWEKAFNL